MKPAKQLRKQYTNDKYPTVILRFEDGHEIHVPKGEGRVFDCWFGEKIIILAVWDPTSSDRELVERRPADAFDNEKPAK